MMYQLQNFSTAAGRYITIRRGDNPGVLADHARALPLVFKSWRVTSPDQRQLPLKPTVLSWMKTRKRGTVSQYTPEEVARMAADWYVERMRANASPANEPFTVYYWQFSKSNTTAGRYYRELVRRLEGFGRVRWHMLVPDAAGAAFGPVITN